MMKINPSLVLRAALSRPSFRLNLARSFRAMLLAAFISCSSTAWAAPILGTTLEQYAVLAYPTITNTGPSTVYGDIGVSPGNTITGYGPGANAITHTGELHLADGDSLQAQIELTNAIVSLQAMTSPMANDLTGQDLGFYDIANPLLPGIYNFDTSAGLTGDLVLDAQGDPNALFVFQIGSTLTTASASTVTVLNGGDNTGVYWVLGTSATLGTGTSFAGNILAKAAITLTTGVTIVCGRALAETEAVTMDTNTISIDCDQDIAGIDTTGRDDFGSGGFSGDGETSLAAVPEPATNALMGLGLLGLFFVRRQRKQATQS